MDALGQISPVQSQSSTQSEPDAKTGVVTSVTAQRQLPQGEPLPSTSTKRRKVTSLPHGETTTESFETLVNRVTDQQAEIKKQAQRIQSLENDLAETQATLNATNHERDYFQQKAAILANFKAFLDKNNLINDKDKDKDKDKDIWRIRIISA